MVFELARHRSLDGPVAGIVDPRCEFVGQQLIAANEQLERQDAHVVEMFEETPDVVFCLGRECRRVDRGSRRAQDSRLVNIAAQRVNRDIAIHITSTDA